MRRISLVTFVSRTLFPSMAPVYGIFPTTTTPSAARASSSSSSSTSNCTTRQYHHHHHQQQQQQQQQQRGTTDFNDTTKVTKSTIDPSPVLLLEGDNFEVSHDGVARTFYHLINHHHPNNNNNNNNNNDNNALQQLGIEEYYDLKEAHKTFVLREGVGCASVDNDDDTCSSSRRNKHDESDVVDVDTDADRVLLLGRQAQGLAPMGRALSHVEIQEIDEGVFGSAGTGATTWESSLVMGLFFADRPHLLRGSLLELGCGVGVGSILSHLGPLVKHYNLPLHSVTLTDGNDQCLEQCRQNIRQAWQTLSSFFSGHQHPPDIQVQKLDWNEDLHTSMLQQFDTIIACDVCYLYPHVIPLASTIRRLLSKNGTCHLFGPCKCGIE